MDPDMMKNAALSKDSIEDVNAMKERSWECGLPPYLQHDLDAYKDGLKNGSTILDGTGRLSAAKVFVEVIKIARLYKLQAII